MNAKNTFTIHTELMDGTLSGVRNIYMGANSTCHLYVIPRDKINVANDIADIAGQSAFYILLGDPNALKPEAHTLVKLPIFPIVRMTTFRRRISGRQLSFLYQIIIRYMETM